MKFHRAFGHIILGVVSLLAFVSVSAAQESYGSVTGTVTDPSGSVVAGASVQLTNIGTNDQHDATTDGAGNYRFVNLVPASYRLEVSNKGFKRMTREPITLPVGGQIRINAILQVGTASEVVQVTGNTPLLETESGTVGNVVEGTLVQEMPLNGRNTMNLIALTPGVVPQGNTAGAPPMNGGIHTQILGWGNYQIGGGIAGENAMYLDGASMMSFGQNSVSLVPTQDSIQEFRVDVNAVSPEFGRFAGGVVEMTTKSGSNVWHGSAYEYLRNTVLNANNFFSNFQHAPRNAFKQNQYGVVASGPIKRDKAFFMFSWEQYSLRMGVATTSNMPTADMNAGKFYNRTLITSAAPAGCITNGLSDSKGTYAQVSPSCFDPSAVAMSSYFLAPNTTTGNNNFFINLPIPNDTYQYATRVDYNLSSKHRIFGRYTYWHLKDAPPHLISDKFDNGIDYAFNRTHFAVLGDTYTINPTTVLDVRAFFNRQFFAHIPIALTNGGIDESQFGPAYAAMAPMMSSHLIPNLTISGPHGIYNVVGTNSNSQDTYNTMGLNGNLTKIIDRHTLKFGGEFRYSDRNGFGTNLYPAGYGTFNASILGDEYAAFLLGDFLNDQISTDSRNTTYNYSQGYFVNDVWQATRSLTLNLGVRWELPGGTAEKKNRATVLLPNVVDPVIGFPGAISLTNTSLYPSRSMIPVRLNLFSPRVSFAQRIGNDMVVRGGYGLNFLPPDLPWGVMAYNSPVNYATTTNPLGSYHSLSDPFHVLSGGSFLQPVGRSNPNWTKGQLGQIVTGANPQDMPYPNIQQWNLTVSRQWAGDWMTEISYVGSKGTHLPGLGAQNGTLFNWYGLNEIAPQTYDPTTGLALTGPDTGKLLTAKSSAPNAACAAWGTALNKAPTVGQCLRPYPQYQDYVDTADYTSGTIYHGMYVVGEKRFHSGGVLHANYTWSKIIGNADNFRTDAESIGSAGYTQDFYNPRGERSLLSFNTAQRLVVSYVLNLPFGKGQRFANSGGIVNTLVSGWSVNGITTFQSGYPLAISYNGNNLTNLFGGGTLRTNYVAGCDKLAGVPSSRYERFLAQNAGNTSAWFNQSCFTNPGAFAFGNEPRVDPRLRGQGIDNFDFAAQKVTKIKELANLQFRAEFFNLFNHPQFNNPGTRMAAGSYNQVTSQANQPRLVQLSLRLTF